MPFKTSVFTNQVAIAKSSNILSWSQLGLLLLAVLSFTACKTPMMLQAPEVTLADEQADLAARHLMLRIQELPKHGYAFGHQDATAYGIGWKNDGSLYKSDVAEVAGDFPAVYGFEVGHLELGHSQNLDTVNFDLMTQLIQKAHRQGGIITISWHPDNPVNGQSAWDTEPAVAEVLEGGTLHDVYQGWLAKLADFLKGQTTKRGRAIPIVFRPFHEMNGDWFWWGASSCTPEEYQQLWRQTHDALTNQYQVHNLLYCYSTDTIYDKEEYLRFYPGDEYVDILGMDLYQKSSAEEYKALLNENLALLAEIGQAKAKPYAMTEGGLERIPIADWWTDVLDDNVADKGLAWALFWRNARLSHHYGPYPGQVSSADFELYEERQHVLFLKDIKRIK